jgi:hypothetical protein
MVSGTLELKTMIFRYGLTSQEIDISATKLELYDLARFFSKGEGSISVEQGVSPSPYERLASCLEIETIPTNLVYCGVYSNKIIVQGDLQKLSVISENILGLADGGSGHMHIEYFEDHPYLCEKSTPLIISCI